jgi:UDP-glucose 4-epimerase
LEVWVVGGAGYIGSHVCKALLAAGHEVAVFDDLSTGLRRNLQPGAAFREGDILDSASLQAAATELGRCDGVIHLAALKAANESMTAPERYGRHNITGSLNLIHAALAAGIPPCCRARAPR